MSKSVQLWLTIGVFRGWTMEPKDRTNADADWAARSDRTRAQQAFECVAERRVAAGGTVTIDTHLNKLGIFAGNPERAAVQLVAVAWREEQVFDKIRHQPTPFRRVGQRCVPSLSLRIRHPLHDFQRFGGSAALGNNRCLPATQHAVSGIQCALVDWRRFQPVCRLHLAIQAVDREGVVVRD
jgi:hypothetical protein